MKGSSDDRERIREDIDILNSLLRAARSDGNPDPRKTFAIRRVGRDRLARLAALETSSNHSGGVTFALAGGHVTISQDECSALFELIGKDSELCSKYAAGAPITPNRGEEIYLLQTIDAWARRTPGGLDALPAGIRELAQALGAAG